MLTNQLTNLLNTNHLLQIFVYLHTCAYVGMVSEPVVSVGVIRQQVNSYELYNSTYYLVRNSGKFFRKNDRKAVKSCFLVSASLFLPV